MTNDDSLDRVSSFLDRVLAHYEAMSLTEQSVHQIKEIVDTCISIGKYKADTFSSGGTRLEVCFLGDADELSR